MGNINYAVSMADKKSPLEGMQGRKHDQQIIQMIVLSTNATKWTFMDERQWLTQMSESPTCEI